MEKAFQQCINLEGSVSVRVEGRRISNVVRYIWLRDRVYLDLYVMNAYTDRVTGNNLSLRLCPIWWSWQKIEERSKLRTWGRVLRYLCQELCFFTNNDFQ